MSESRTHHPYSPSKLQYLEACPCYENRESNHERTLAGTIAHGVAESGKDDNRLGDDDAAAAAECLDFVEQRRRLMQEDALAVPIIELKETYLPIDDLQFADAQSTTAGYIDHGFISHDGTYAEIFDWKFGFWPVEQADNNLQGLAYCLGTFHRFPKLEKVRFFFKQPHLQTISDVLVSRADVPALYLRIQVVVARARAARTAGNFDTARPMVPVCNFCAHIAKCPKVTEFACRVGAKFHPLVIPENITPTMIHGTRDTVLGLQLAQVVAVWARAFKSQITDRVIRGEADMPPNHVLQQRSDREVVNPEKYKEIALQYVTETEYSAACTVTFGKVEEAIKDKSPRGQKKATIDQFNTQLADSGAVKHGQPYTFLRVVADKKVE